MPEIFRPRARGRSRRRGRTPLSTARRRFTGGKAGWRGFRAPAVRGRVARTTQRPGPPSRMQRLEEMGVVSPAGRRRFLAEESERYLKRKPQQSWR